MLIFRQSQEGSDEKLGELGTDCPVQWLIRAQGFIARCANHYTMDIQKTEQHYQIVPRDIQQQNTRLSSTILGQELGNITEQ